MSEASFPRSVRWSLAVAGGLLGFDVVWLVVGLGHVWEHPVLGWVPLPVGALLAGTACLRVVRDAAVDDTARRFWRHLMVACGLFTAGIVANTVDAVGGAAPSQRVGPVSLAFYLGYSGW
ncbi:hypothetical protein [Cryptosporangium sp. NPDC048952]|uniref:hypothetical protein n=1 Tax=Cryptosporangium sp. NPDC048952 TaxID=3363961 RepID=UPI00371A1C65